MTTLYEYFFIVGNEEVKGLVDKDDTITGDDGVQLENRENLC